MQGAALPRRRRDVCHWALMSKSTGQTKESRKGALLSLFSSRRKKYKHRHCHKITLEVCIGHRFVPPDFLTRFYHETILLLFAFSLETMIWGSLFWSPKYSGYMWFNTDFWKQACTAVLIKHLSCMLQILTCLCLSPFIQNMHNFQMWCRAQLQPLQRSLQRSGWPWDSALISLIA